ncbi:MAG: electron transport complex subunit RsxE, partial [Oscillospiraceae bacterium]|nr:electron transport complex subunit RsxE [Oscillospiraceae bacterium]
MPAFLAVILTAMITDNFVLSKFMGICPFLGVSKKLKSAVGMAAAAAVVLILSNLAISLLRNIIPDKVRIPCYIVVIAGFVTVVEMLMHA